MATLPAPAVHSTPARTPQTVYRFMPGRNEAAEDGRMLFGGARYSRIITNATDKQVYAGVGVGPTIDGADADFELIEGGLIVPAHGIERQGKIETVPVRDHFSTDKRTGKQRKRQFIDWATFQDLGSGCIRVIPDEGKKVVAVEIWTGNWAVGDESPYQLIPAGLFNHGAIGYGGGGKKLLSAAGQKRGKTESTEEIGVSGEATKVGKDRLGAVIGGIPLWIVSTWNVEHDGNMDSDAILIRQLNRFWLWKMKNGIPDPVEVKAAIYLKRWEERWQPPILATAA